MGKRRETGVVATVSEAVSRQLVEASGQKISPGRWAEIIEAAAVLFSGKGYAATSMQDVADAVGMLKGSLYYYIKTKDDLLFAVLNDVHERGLGSAAQLLESKLDPIGMVRAFVERHVLFTAHHHVSVTVFFQDFRALSEPRKEAILRERDSFESSLRSLIEAGQRADTICSDIDARLAARGILGMINWMYQWYKPGGRLRDGEIAKQIGDLVVHSLACEGMHHKKGHRSTLGAVGSHVAADYSFGPALGVGR